MMIQSNTQYNWRLDIIRKHVKVGEAKMKSCSIDFVEDADVIAMGAVALKITSWFYAFLGIIYVTRGVLNGIGDAFFAMLNGIVEIACRLIFPLLLTSIPLFGVWGIWWSVGVTWFLSAVTALMRYFYMHRKSDLRFGDNLS